MDRVPRMTSTIPANTLSMYTRNAWSKASSLSPANPGNREALISTKTIKPTEELEISLWNCFLGNCSNTITE